MILFCRKKILSILPPFLKVVTGSTLSDVAKMVIQHVRLPLLEPEALSEIELQNAKDQFIPVRPFIMKFL